MLKEFDQPLTSRTVLNLQRASSHSSHERRLIEVARAASSPRLLAQPIFTFRNSSGTRCLRLNNIQNVSFVLG